MAKTPEELLNTIDKYARSLGIQLNADREYVLELIEGLLKNEARYGYRSCPCRLASGYIESDKDIICPCAYMKDDIKDYGSCYCGLYVSEACNSGVMKHNIVPERRIPRR